jgi:hypothetical protein
MNPARHSRNQNGKRQVAKTRQEKQIWHGLNQGDTIWQKRSVSVRFYDETRRPGGITEKILGSPGFLASS